MTSPICLLLILAIVSKVGITGLKVEYGQTKLNNNNNTLPNINSIRDRSKITSEIMYSNKKNNLRIFNETLLKGIDINKRVKRNGLEDRCVAFNTLHTHPHPSNDTKYYRKIDCITVINGTEGTILELKFVDLFDIEFHPHCDYDYLEIRDGTRGYAPLLGGRKLCGQQFPEPINTTGPHAWLKFHSDNTIEHEGFRIKVTEIQSPKSRVVPESCHIMQTGASGVLDISAINQRCKDESANQPLEVLWSIEADTNFLITLNFTKFELAKRNSCKDNFVQVFGSVIEYDAKLAHFCGTIAETVTTSYDASKNQEGNVMHVRFYASKATKDFQKFIAQYTVFRKLESTDDECNSEEFNCQDGTCIASYLKCDSYANCRLKTDEQPEICRREIDVFNEDIQVIIIILSLIVSGMMIVFLFKCFRKLYMDQKMIKEHRLQSIENGLDIICERRLTLDDSLERDSQAGTFLEKEKENLTKQNVSKHKARSIDSIFDQGLNSDVELWIRDVDNVPEPEKISVEYNGKTKLSDLSKKEQTLRSKRESSDRNGKNEEQNEGVEEKRRTKRSDQNKKEESLLSKRESSERKREKEEQNEGVEAKHRKKRSDLNKKSLWSNRESKERDKDETEVSAVNADMKEFGCQTRDSLFQSDPTPSSKGSARISHRLSTFEPSAANIARPSSPPQTMASEITIELLREDTPQDPVKLQKKSDHRPTRAETTRSAPDVIIVAKPIF